MTLQNGTRDITHEIVIVDMKQLLFFASITLFVGVVSRPLAAEEAGEELSDAIARDTVVVLHGLGRGRSAMWFLGLRIENAGFDVVRIGYDSLRETPEEILADVVQQVDRCCRALANPVHFVGHSLGGLIIRGYLAAHRPAHLGRVVLIGTPNNGTPLVDRFRDSWWLSLAGPTALELGTGPDSFPASLPDPDYPVGVIAGVGASVLISDLIPGDDDGLVSVESTKIPGMTDFILVDLGHALMRYSDEVARQTVAFLQRGRFIHAQ